jgi:hypothetical protein
MVTHMNVVQNRDADELTTKARRGTMRVAGTLSVPASVTLDGNIACVSRANSMASGIFGRPSCEWLEDLGIFESFSSLISLTLMSFSK